MSSSMADGRFGSPGSFFIVPRTFTSPPANRTNLASNSLPETRYTPSVRSRLCATISSLQRMKSLPSRCKYPAGTPRWIGLRDIPDVRCRLPGSEMRGFSPVTRGSRLQRLSPLCLCLALGSCATTQDIQRYRRGEAPPTEFVTDGCSVVPDFDFGACCVAHDRAYWQGGSCADRAAADRALAGCIRDSGHPVLADVYGVGVRIGGHALLPFPWRWGYGWPFGIGCIGDPDERTKAGHGPVSWRGTNSQIDRSVSGDMCTVALAGADGAEGDLDKKRRTLDGRPALL